MNILIMTIFALQILHFLKTMYDLKTILWEEYCSRLVSVF